MNISSLNTPATPPYEYQNTTITTKEYDVHYFDRHLSPAHQSVDSDMETGHHSAFRRVSPISMPSPPELLIDSEEEFEEALATPSHLLSNYILKQQGENQYTSSNYSMKQRKSVPHRSPIGEPSHAPLGESVVFQLDDKPSLICKPRIVNEKSLLWTLRQRVSSARQQQPYHRPSHHRLSAPRFERRAKPMRIQIPRPQWSTSDQEEEAPVSPPHWEATTAHQPLQDIVTSTVDVLAAAASWQADLMKKPQTALKQTERKKPSTKRPGSHHASSGRPSRVKGPCQACHETSDGCMRKAFNWPFSTSSIFNDKGKPFVYLCNKCGLRYNKSGGCVCRHCRWVLCKEEKRKAMQLIELMRRSRPDGKVDPEEDIENFVCAPKYWSCGRPWKVGWVLHSQHDEDEEMIEDHPSPYSSDSH